MRRLAAAALFLVALVAPAGAQDAAGRVVQVPDAAVAALGKAMPLVEDAQRAFAAKDWDGAVKLYADAFEALGGADVLGGWRDQTIYNTACAHARAGRAAEAAIAFAKSVKNGLRPVLGRDSVGRWTTSPGLTLEHVMVDSDLDPIRASPSFVAALRPFLAAGEPVVEFTRPDTSSRVAAVIVLAAEGQDADRALPAWRVAARGRRIALAALAGPVRPTPSDRRWVLGDGDDRWAAAKVKETLDLLSKDPRVDPSRVFLVGVGERPGEAAWAAAMAEPTRLAGLAAPGARFHAAWHADVALALPTTWRVALHPADAEAAKMLNERGIDAATVAPSKDESEVAAAILDAMLGKR